MPTLARRAVVADTDALMADGPSVKGAVMEPVWPELIDVIQDSPALVLPSRYMIAEVDQIPVDVPTLMTFQDEVEKTVIVTVEDLSRSDARRSRGPYVAIRLQLAKPFLTPGLLASAAFAVARMRVTQIVYSSYSFDYVLVEEQNLEAALIGLASMGFPIEGQAQSAANGAAV